MLKKKIIFCIVLISLTLIISNGFGNDRKSKELEGENCIVLTTNSDIEYSDSFLCPKSVSSKENKIDYINLILVDADKEYVFIEGPDANRLDIVQNGYTLIRIYGLQSYPYEREYKYHSSDKDERIKYGMDDEIVYDFARNFEVSNGTNKVDLILYNNEKEVLRINDYEIEVYNEMVVRSISGTYLGLDNLSPTICFYMINGENLENIMDLDIEFLDLKGHKIGSTEIINASLDGSYFEVKWNIEEEPKVLENYKIVVKNNGEKLKILDSWNKTVVFTDEILINSWELVTDIDYPKVYFRGRNLKLGEPFSAMFIQNDKQTIVENINSNYNQIYDKSEIEIKIPADIEDVEAPFNVKIYDKDGNEVIFAGMNQVYSYYDEDDKYDKIPYNHTRFATAFNVKKNKIWTVTFSGAIDKNTIDSSIYVLDDRGRKVDILLNLIDSRTVKVIPGNEYKENVLYSLWIEGVKSKNGIVTKKAGIDFVIG